MWLLAHASWQYSTGTLWTSMFTPMIMLRMFKMFLEPLLGNRPSKAWINFYSLRVDFIAVEKMPNIFWNQSSENKGSIQGQGILIWQLIEEMSLILVVESCFCGWFTRYPWGQLPKTREGGAESLHFRFRAQQEFCLWHLLTLEQTMTYWPLWISTASPEVKIISAILKVIMTI